MTHNSIKILVNDDHQDNLITINALIKDAFHETIILNALNGKTGLELAANEVPDVILLDILMPDMDGYEVCQKLKSNQELCDISVVVTAIENQADIITASAMRFNTAKNIIKIRQNLKKKKTYRQDQAGSCWRNFKTQVRIGEGSWR